MAHVGPIYPHYIERPPPSMTDSPTRYIPINPNDCELLPDGSRIQETTTGALADWLAENPPQGCGCENPQPYQLCCPAVTLIPTVTPLRGGPKPKKRRKR